MPSKKSNTGRAVVPAKNTNLAHLPERITIGDREVRPEQLYTINDRRPSARGPWTDEPFDKIAWQDAETGLDCILLRQPSGAWGGFVAVVPEHPLYGYREDAIPAATRFTPHGGIDYAKPCARRLPEAIQICHARVRPSPFTTSAPTRADHEREEAWWLGFTANKAGDLVPSVAKPPLAREEGETYRDVGYMYGETIKLARQLKAIEEPGGVSSGSELPLVPPRLRKPQGR